jgi:hypothetical protein
MGNLLFSFLFVLSTHSALAADLPYKDGDFGCFSQADATRYINDFSVNVDSFGGLELCNNAKDTKKLLNDFSLIEHTLFEADQKHGFIRGIVHVNDYYGWMKTQTYGVERGNDVPFATAYNRNGYFTMQDGWAVLSSLGRVGVVIHEARHTAGFPHYQCKSGPYAGSNVPGCDTGITQQGAHGVEIEYYTRVVLDGKNLSPVYQSMARLMALGRANFVFNEQPMRTREGLLALAGGKTLLADGSGPVVARELPNVESGSRLKRTSAGASLVKGQKAVAVDIYGQSTGSALSDDYSYYKLFQTPRQNAPTAVLDSEEIDLGKERYFAALDANGSLVSYDFANGAWFRGVNSGAGSQALVTRAPNGQAGLFVVKSDGSILPFDFDSRRFGAALKDRWDSNTRAYALLGNQLVVLSAAGAVLAARTGAAIPAFAGQQVTDLVNVPLYDAFEVAQ